MPTTERRDYVFTPQEELGEIWISLEPYGDDLEILKDGFLGFDLPEGTTVEEGQEIAQYLNEKIRRVSYTNLSDVIYYVLDSNNPNAKYSAPNKLFEALAAGKAVVCGDHGEIAKIVTEERCGIVLNRDDERHLPEILSDLAANGEVRSFKSRALAAGREKYNWAKAEKALLQAYCRLLAQDD